MKRSLPGEYSQSSKKFKTREVLGAFTSNTNVGHRHSTHIPDDTLQAHSNFKSKAKGISQWFNCSTTEVIHFLQVTAQARKMASIAMPSW